MNPQAEKLFRLALDSSAGDGEWRNAAILAVKSLRAEGFNAKGDRGGIAKR